MAETAKAKKDAPVLIPAPQQEEPVIQQEKVTIFVPKTSAKDEPNLMIGINGKNYLLPRGKQSTVPREVADEFYRSQAAQTALESRMAEMQDTNKHRM